MSRTDRATLQPDSGRAAMLATLFDLFRVHGVEGVSIGDISRATGLGRSSLYHHFPGGKEQMVAEVASFGRAGVDSTVLAPLGHGTRRERIAAMLAAVDGLFAGGTSPCLLASLSLGAPPGEVREATRATLAGWVAALARALQETGETDAGRARARALEAIIRIEGALVVARVLGDRAPFTETLAALGQELLA